jgi:toxin YoeB
MKPLQFSQNSWPQYHKLTDEDRKMRKKIAQLIESIDRDGKDKGLGKPEPLSGDQAGRWSRHIDKKNRLIYSVTEDNIIELYEVGTYYDDK